MKKTLAMLFLLACAGVVLADTIAVSGGGFALQSAVDKAKAGDILVVAPGTYSAFDTQGKQITVKSEKGPSQTFIAGAYLTKSYMQNPNRISAFCVSDSFAKRVAQGNQPTRSEIIETAEKTRIVGFTFAYEKTGQYPRSHIVGAHVVDCVLNNTSTLFSIVESSLVVNRDYTKVICTDSRLVNSTVIVGTQITSEEALFCCELANTIVYDVNRGAGTQIIVGWDGATKPQMSNSFMPNGVLLNEYNGYQVVEDDPGIARTDPGFVDVAADDYHLSQGSPCVDAGDNGVVSCEWDVAGGDRIVNGRVDVGAYEFGATPGYDGSGESSGSGGGFTGAAAMTLNGIVKDASGTMCGIAQVVTAKATKKGVKVSGFVMLADGKKQTLKTATVAIVNGALAVATKIGTADASLTVTGEGFTGTFGDLTLASAAVGEDTGVLKGTITMSYFDAKTGKVKTKSIKLTGVASEGAASGSLTVKGAATKTFAAEME